MQDRTCTIDGCEGKLAAKGLCAAHRRRKKLGLPMEAPIRQRGGTCSQQGCYEKNYGNGLCRQHWQAVRPTCSVENCTRTIVARGWCRLHYGRWWKTGDHKPEQELTAQFSSDDEYFHAHVEKSDGCWNWTGGTNDSGYAMFWRGRPNGIKAHRFAYELLVGPIPDGLYIDHRCHNRRCVNPDHLRPVTEKQNNENRYGAISSNTSGVRGVVFYKGKWVANVGHRGRKYYLGRFDTLAEAESAAIARRNELFTHNDRDRNCLEPSPLSSLDDART